MIPVFITGTGTGVGKTITSAIVCNALDADYWKPVQSGNTEGTDSELLTQLLNPGKQCHPEVYSLVMPASPHIAARKENIFIDLDIIKQHFLSIQHNNTGAGYLVIEGAGGLMVPLNNQEFISDLILKLNAKVILVSRNYLGSINHSLLTAAVCRQLGIDVIGWIFNDDYMHYQDEIADWSGFPVIGTIPELKKIDRETLSGYSSSFRKKLSDLLQKTTL